ncbi:hypothetical protein [Mesorhizobium sp. M0213]|uniref:hypothetical protein n=1 Tax=unclassified Mesorhizobium TaxID=325217 RepID=UPI003337FEF3
MTIASIRMLMSRDPSFQLVAIERQILSSLQVEHVHYEPRRHGLVEPDELEEPL